MNALHTHICIHTFKIEKSKKNLKRTRDKSMRGLSYYKGKKTNRIDEINRVRGAIIVACLGILNLLKQANKQAQMRRVCSSVTQDLGLPKKHSSE